MGKQLFCNVLSLKRVTRVVVTRYFFRYANWFTLVCTFYMLMRQYVDDNNWDRCTFHM